MRVKKKKIKTRVVDNKLITSTTVYVMSDDDGEVVRKADFPFPNGKETKELVVLLNLDDLEEALF